MRLLIYLISFVFLSLAASCSPTSRPGDACERDSDCAVDEICHAGVCAAVECKLDSDCDAAERCQDHTCVPAGCGADGDCAEPTPRCDLDIGVCVACLGDGDCDAGERCVEGACRPTGCQSDLDCAAPTPRCDQQSGACVACLSDGDCGARERCLQGACQPTGCQSDLDCAAPTPRCDVEARECVECLTPEDCAAGQICSGGRCAAEPACETDDSCEIGQICEAGDCVAGCRSQRDCPPGEQCIADLGPHGTCVECQTDPDCPPGQRCEEHRCQVWCTQDAHCAPLHCDLDSHQCVECTADEHCDRAAGLICEQLACVPGCRQDADCPAGFCDPDALQCVDCLNSDHCSLGLICFEQHCVAGCETDRDCPAGRLCDPQAGAHGSCVECLTDQDCDPAYLCHGGWCEFHCASDADCAPPTPACDGASGTCVACTDGQHCPPGNVCIGQQCLPGCSIDADCPPGQVCDPDLGQHGGCVDCRTNADCPAGFACQQNRCVVEGEQTVRLAGGMSVRGSDPGEGDADEEPELQVSLPTFYIDRTEVTNEQYRACEQAGACTEPFEMTAYNDPTKARHPVVYVSWSQALAYCEWKGMHLPTEARWERAARGLAPDERTYPWGDAAASCGLANYSGCVGGTDVVGARPAGTSAEGVLDLAGNVWEWVADFYQTDYYAGGVVLDPPGPGYGQYRVVRGGAYDGLPSHIRAANRASRPPDQASPNVGFRCAMVGAPTAAFEVWPEQAPYDTTFSVDASASTDPNHPLDALEVRWDWEGDGAWDTNFSTAKTAAHRYAAPGFYSIQLEIRDPDGNTDRTSWPVVAEGSDGWDGDPCAADADCASGFFCVSPLLASDYRCRESCFLNPTCSYPGYTCDWVLWIEGLPFQACLPP